MSFKTRSFLFFIDIKEEKKKKDHNTYFNLLKPNIK